MARSCLAKLDLGLNHAWLGHLCQRQLNLRIAYFHRLFLLHICLFIVKMTGLFLYLFSWILWVWFCVFFFFSFVYYEFMFMELRWRKNFDGIRSEYFYKPNSRLFGRCMWTKFWVEKLWRQNPLLFFLLCFNSLPLLYFIAVVCNYLATSDCPSFPTFPQPTHLAPIKQNSSPKLNSGYVKRVLLSKI